MDKKLTLLLAFILIFAGLATAARAITINPTYIDGAGYTWDSTRRGVIQQAINDWQSALPDNHTVNVTFDLTNAGSGGYLGLWEGNYSLYSGTDVYPWTSGVTHAIHFNANHFSGTNYTWWDPTPTTSNDLPFAGWDALSVARHEIGHMMGFTDQFYVDNFNTSSEFDKWGTHISGSTFDPGGLNVSMEATYDWGHVRNSGSTAGDLMVTALVNGVRRNMSVTDLNMLHLAYGYTVVPPPIPPTSTTYTLTATASKTTIHAGGSCTVTAKITNTGTGTADTLDFTGLSASTDGGTLSGSSTSGGPLAQGGNASNSGYTFSSPFLSSGKVTITPAATGTNHTLGTAATQSSVTKVEINVYSGQGVWNTTGSGSWTDAIKWTTAGGVPGIDGALSASDWATFSQSFSSPSTVSLNGATPRLAGLNLNPINNNSFTLARGTGSGILTLQAPAGTSAALTAYHGTNIISVPVNLGGDARIACDTDATLSFSGGISGSHMLTVWFGTITASSIQVDTLRVGNFAGAAVGIVPEPSTIALLGMAVTILLGIRIRRRSHLFRHN